MTVTGSKGIEQASRAPLEPEVVNRFLRQMQGADVGAPSSEPSREPWREPWPEPWLLVSVGSTNHELGVRAGLESLPEGSCLVAEHQFAGRGRLGRAWESPNGAGLWVSVLVDIEQIPVARLGWLPLVAGLAISGAIGEVTGIDVRLKWPNDLVIDGLARDESPGPRKIGGILVETTGQGNRQAIVGFGVNVSLRPEELPTAQATSILTEKGSCLDRAHLLAAELTHLHRRLAQWRNEISTANTSITSVIPTTSIRDDYQARCLSLGRQVRVALPGGEEIVGIATEISPDGLLGVTDGEEIVRFVAAGDVIHARI